MKAKFDGLDYHLYLDKQEDELRKVKDKSLEAGLQSFRGDKDLGIKVVLAFGEVKNPQGIELSMIPENAHGFEHIQCIDVTIGDYAYSLLEYRCEVTATYMKTDNKIRILNR